MRVMRKLTRWMVGATLIGTTASQAELVFKTARGPAFGDGFQWHLAATTTVENVENEFHTLLYGSLGTNGFTTTSGIGQLTNADGSVTNTFGAIAARTGSFSMVFRGFTTNNIPADLFVNNNVVGVGLNHEAVRFGVWGGQAFEIEFDLSGIRPPSSSIFLNKAAFEANGVSDSSGLNFITVAKNGGANLVVASNLTEVAVGVEISHGDVIRFENITGSGIISPRFAVQDLTFDSVANTTLNPIPEPVSEIEFKLTRGPDNGSHRRFKTTTTTVEMVEIAGNHPLTYDSILFGSDGSTGNEDFTDVRTNVWGVGREAETKGGFYDGTTGSFAMTFEALKDVNTPSETSDVVTVNNNGMFVNAGRSFTIDVGEAIRVTFNLSGLTPIPDALSLNSMVHDNTNLDASDIQFLLDGVDISPNALLNGSEVTFSGANIQSGHALEIRNVHSDGENLVFGLKNIRVGVRQASDYEQWKDLYNLLGEDAEDDADPDGDLLSNVYEYGLGGDPTNAADTGHSAQYTVIGKSVFEYVYPQRKHEQSGVQYYIETDTNLIFPPEWTNAGYAVTGTGDISALEFEAVTNAIPIGGNDQQFIRLIIEPTP